MANYTIIGGDKKEYGPVTAEEVRQWIAEGRLDAFSQARSENDTEWRPLSTFAEFTAAFQAKAHGADSPPPAIGPITRSTPDKELDVFACLQKGYTLVKNNAGLLITGTVIFGMIVSAMSMVVSELPPAIARFAMILGPLVSGPLTGGLFYLFLKQIRGQEGALGDVFAGFRMAFIPLFLGGMVMLLVIELCMAPASVVYGEKIDPLLTKFQQVSPTSPADVQNLANSLWPQVVAAFWSYGPIFLLCAIPAMYLSINWQFTLPLIIDKKMNFWPAMKLSWRVVHRHWWQIFGLVVLTQLLNVVGLLVCCLGVFFTMPVGFAALMFAYEVIFSKSETS